MHVAGEVSGEIEPDDPFVRVAHAGRLTGFAARAALFAGESEHADAHRADVETDAAEDRLA